MTLAWLTYGIKLNLSFALHCEIYYNCDLLFSWDGIHLYLVIANEILTNLLKAMPSLNPYLLIGLTLHMSPNHKWVMNIIPHTCWAINGCELTSAITPHSWRAGTTRGGLLWWVRWDVGVVSKLAVGIEEIIILVGFIYFQLYYKTLSLCNKDYDIRLHTLSHCMCNTPGVTRTKTWAWHHMHWHVIMFVTPKMHPLG
jgi:hypothetical protein